MKLLVLGPDIRDRRKVKNFTGQQAFYLARELRARGVALEFIEWKFGKNDPLPYLRDVDPRGADHVLAMGLRWFTHQVPGCAIALKTKTMGAVTQMHDGVVHNMWDAWMNGVDCTFTFRDDSDRTKHWERYAARNHHVGWAADPDLLYPCQNGKELRILIDHPYYKSGQPDITAAVTEDALAFAYTGDWIRRGFRSIKIRRLVNGGAEDVTIHSVTKQFDRLHVPFEDIANEYRKAHVFMVTHKESVGLTCLELAMCGALVVTSNGLIYQDRLNTLRYVSYDGVRAPWNDVLDMINIKASAEMAQQQTWEKVADRMLQWFGDYK
jgi:hypothetical protein